MVGPHPHETKPHAVCLPFPAQGHINPMLKVAKLLHSKGFHITFVNSEYNHRRLLKSIGAEALRGLSSFRFATIPDGLPPSDDDVTQHVPSLCESTRRTCLAPFRDLVNDLNRCASSSLDVPPVTCIVSDGIMTFTLKVARQLGIPDVLFWTNSAAGVMGYLQYRNLIQKGLVPLRDASDLTNGYLDTVIDWIPGMKGIRLKDLPTFIRTTDPDDIMLNFAIGEVEKVSEASALILNTFDDLEQEIIDSLFSLFQTEIFTIGPLQLLEKNPEFELLYLDGKPIKSNLWKEQEGCLEWLDSKDPRSVVYVNFGSVTVMSRDQLVEFAWGLANSNLSFLWVIRPDVVSGETAMLPPEFVTDTKSRGLLASWCPQEEILSHPSIGSFLSHCGWNSTIESLGSGVPMMCWPFFAEQQTNSWLCCNVWGVGMEMCGDVRREEIERLVRELMADGEKAKELRGRANEWKELGNKATALGASHVNFNRLVDVLLSNTPPKSI